MPKKHRKERGRYHDQAEFDCFAEILRPVFFQRMEHALISRLNRQNITALETTAPAKAGTFLIGAAAGSRERRVKCGESRRF